MTEKYRSNKHVLLLYPDDLSHVQAFEKIKQSIDYCAILHDKDFIKETGEIKKAHWHVVLKYKNCTWNTALSEEFGLALNYIQRVRNEEAMLEYLIHANEEDKYQYPLEEVFGTKNLINKLKKCLEADEMTEGQKIMELIDFIEQSTQKITFTAFARYCAENNRWSEYRRAGGIFNKIIEEKNNLLDKIPSSHLSSVPY